MKGKDNVENILDFISSHVDEIKYLEEKNPEINNFFEITYQGKKPNQKEFHELVNKSFKNEGNNGVKINPFENPPQNYITIGAWIGDQGYALAFMAIAEDLGFAKVATPTLKAKKDIQDNMVVSTRDTLFKNMSDEEIEKFKAKEMNVPEAFKYFKQEMGQGHLYMFPELEVIKKFSIPSTDLPGGGGKPKQASSSPDFRSV